MVQQYLSVCNRIMKLNDEMKVPPEEKVSENKTDQQSAQSVHLIRQKKVRNINRVLLEKSGRRIIKKMLVIVLSLAPHWLMIPVIFHKLLHLKQKFNSL